MSDLTRMAAKPVTLTVGGEEYSFSPLTVNVTGFAAMRVRSDILLASCQSSIV